MDPAKLVSLFGIFGFVGIAFIFSSNRKKIDWKLVGMGIVLQFVFAILVLKTRPGILFFDKVNTVVDRLLGYTNEGSKFIFGSLVLNPEAFGDYVFAVQVLPTIIFFSSLMALFYHLGIMQWIVDLIARSMVKILGTSGAETLSVSANIFVGQTEAPLLIKPYVGQMTRSELMVVMTGGFATVAGGVMAAYVSLLKSSFPDIAGHLMAASIMGAPAALVMAKILIPETEEPKTKGAVKISVEKVDANAIEAAANGAAVGLTLAFNVGAMLLAFIALIAMVDGILGWMGGFVGFDQLSLSWISSLVFWPMAWLMGVPVVDCAVAGELLGKKLILNEFVAYSDLATILADTSGDNPPLTGRTVVILTYALCGFANFSSIGIQIGGLGGIAPERKGDLARLGLVAVLGGTLACFQTATIAGVLTDESEVRILRPASEIHSPPDTFKTNPVELPESTSEAIKVDPKNDDDTPGPSLDPTASPTPLPSESSG